jgi:hypothetical protein
MGGRGMKTLAIVLFAAAFCALGYFFFTRRGTEQPGVRLRYFCFDKTNGHSVPSATPIECSQAEAEQVWASISPVPGSFFGVVTQNNETVQFYWEEDYITIDVPLPQKKGSLDGKATFDETLTALRQVFSGVPPTELKGLQFESWQ